MQFEGGAGELSYMHRWAGGGHRKNAGATSIGAEEQMVEHPKTESYENQRREDNSQQYTEIRKIVASDFNGCAECLATSLLPPCVDTVSIYRASTNEEYACN